MLPSLFYRCRKKLVNQSAKNIRHLNPYIVHKGRGINIVSIYSRQNFVSQIFLGHNYFIIVYHCIVNRSVELAFSF